MEVLPLICHNEGNSLKCKMSTNIQSVNYDTTSEASDSVLIENGCSELEGLTNGDSNSLDEEVNSKSFSEKPTMRLSQSEESEIISLSRNGEKENGDCVSENVNSDGNKNNSNVNVETSSAVKAPNDQVIDSAVEQKAATPMQNNEGTSSPSSTPPASNTNHVIEHADIHQTPVADVTPTTQQNHVTNATPTILDGQMTFASAMGPHGQMIPTPLPPNMAPTMPAASQLTFNSATGPTNIRRPTGIEHTHGGVTQGAMSPQGNSSQTTPPQSGTNTPSPNNCTGSNGTPAAPHTHVVHVHISHGETFTVRVDDQLQHIQGPATVRMVSNNGPPLPMPMQVPPGHMVQQIVDENGILTHVILSPQPPGMIGNPMTGGPNNGPPYYPPFGGPFSNHPQYPSPHHHAHHSGAPTPGARGAQPHMTHQHGTPPPTCNNHGGPVHSQGPSPPINSMEERANRMRTRMKRKHQIRENEGYYNRDRGPPRRNKVKGGPNGVDSPTPSSISSLSHSTAEEHSELEEERRVIQTHLSNMPSPKASDFEGRPRNSSKYIIEIEGGSGVLWSAP